MTIQHNHQLDDREDGLAHCLVCGGAEGSLPTHCPGERMPAELQDAVYAGQVDYVCGHWVACMADADTVIRLHASHNEQEELHRSVEFRFRHNNVYQGTRTEPVYSRLLASSAKLQATLDRIRSEEPEDTYARALGQAQD